MEGVVRGEGWGEKQTGGAACTLHLLILGPRPAKRPRGPASTPRAYRRYSMDPLGPWPLLICDRRVSAGYHGQCELRHDSDRSLMPCCPILTGASIRCAQAGIPTHMREHRRGETRHDTGRQGDGEAGRGGEVGLLLGGHLVVDEFCASLVDCELTDGVGDLLGEDGDEAGVERGEALGRCDLGEARDEAGGVLRGELARRRERTEERGGRKAVESGHKSQSRQGNDAEERG